MAVTTVLREGSEADPWRTSRELFDRLQVEVEVAPGFGTGQVVGSEPFRHMLDGADDEEDETEDRRGAGGEDRAGDAAPIHRLSDPVRSPQPLSRQFNVYRNCPDSRCHRQGLRSRCPELRR